MNVRKLLICLGVCILCTQMTVFAEDTTALSNLTTPEQSQNTPSITSDAVGEEVISDTSDQEDLTGDIDETNFTQEEENANTGEAELLPEFIFYGDRELPEGYQQFVNYALDKSNMPIDILINSKYLKSDSDALVINNTTYVPIRALFEAFGYKDITFDNDTYKASAKSTLGEFQFLLNTTEVYVNGHSTQMEKPSLVINGRTMVPLRFISEYFGFNVAWDPKYYTVNLISDTFQVNAKALNGRFYSFDEFTTFAKLIMKEAGSVSYETKHAVASVVMNQVRHPGLANTINGVIFAVSRSPHFPPAHKAGFLDTVPNKECIMAAKMTLRGENSAGPCIFFNTRPFKGKTVYKVSDGVYFCY